MARVGRVDVPDIWLQPGTMVVLGLGRHPSAPCRHGAWWGTVACVASGGSASGRPLMDLASSVEFGRRWSPRGAAGRGGSSCFFIVGGFDGGGGRLPYCCRDVLKLRVRTLHRLC
uniref:Uncharacterized protein n=1 Tax=Triticum urartu TaxID=4572 RepID=A0A8R7TS94_TRIUA